MKHALLVFSLLLSYSLYADSLDVSGYKQIPNDIAATQYPRYDANDDQCALIKVISDIDGLNFDAGRRIVGNVEKKYGEYWVYVSEGERRLSIWGPDLFRYNFNLPSTPKSGRVYQLVVTRAGQSDIGGMATGIVLIKSTPPGARVYIDGEFMQLTPFQQEMTSGYYNYRIEKEMFYPREGGFTIKVNETHIEEVSLDPNFGSLTVTSTPVTGATISLKVLPTGCKTPHTFDTLKSGTYTLALQIDLYEPLSREVTIRDNIPSNLELPLTATFGNMQITTEPEADIYIDGALKATGYFTGILTKGVHTIEVKKEKYYPQSRKVDIEVGSKENIPFVLEPITGSLSVFSEPPEAEIMIDGEARGMSPKIITGLIIGEHEVVLKKNNYATVTKTVTIRENERAILNENLDNFREITIRTEPNGASLTLNGKFLGNTPQTTVTNFGINQVKLSKQGYNDFEKEFSVTEQKKEYSFAMTSDFMAQAMLDFKKYKRRQNLWLIGTAVSAGMGGYFYFSAEQKYEDYQTATEDASDLHKQIETEDILWPVAFGVSGFCAVMTIVNAAKKGKAKRTMNFSLVPLNGGGIVRLAFHID
jgi:hypothetical protein